MRNVAIFLAMGLSALRVAAAAAIDPCGLLNAAELDQLAVSSAVAPKLKDEGYRRSCSYGEQATLALVAPGEKLMNMARTDTAEQKPDQHGPTDFRSASAKCAVLAKPDAGEFLICSTMAERRLITLRVPRPQPQGERAFPARELKLIEALRSRVRSFEAAEDAAAPPPLPAPASNVALRELMNQDQLARTSGLQAKDPVNVHVQDEERRKAVKEILRAGGVNTAEDFYNAGLIFQHGDAVEDYRLAHSFANMALLLDPDSRSAKWLQAASLDRMLMELGKKQWFGTSRGEPIEESYISDADRKAMGMSTLAELRARAAGKK